MTGGNVPYNLRPNKYIERQLFIEVLMSLYAVTPKKKLVYVSLGGPQLEDPKLVHYQLGIRSLISLELDPVIYNRQLFNLRPFVDCRKNSTDDFIKSFDTLLHNKQLIIWLDYANSNERREQLGEYESLISKLGPGDTVKITMNANPGSLGERAKGESLEDTFVRRLNRLVNTIGDYLPEGLTTDDVRGKRFISVICKAVKRAAQQAATRMEQLEIIPVAIFTYNDGQHQMVTVTIHITRAKEVRNIRKQLVNAGWEFLPTSWDDVTTIDVPNLTPKERLFIEGMLFRRPTTKLERLHKKLPFRLAEEEDESLVRLAQFAKHYRRYPSYLPVLL